MTSITYYSRHLTVYDYTLPVTISHHATHLIPRNLPTQTIHHGNVRVDPKPAHYSKRTDYFGNHALFFTLEEAHRSLSVESSYLVTVEPTILLAENITPPWEKVREHLVFDLSLDVLEACQYVFDSPFITINPAITDYARSSFPQSRPLLSAVIDLMHRIHRDFIYDPTATTLATPLVEVLRKKRGVCQDFAHLQIACCRSMGLAARYVSGYLHTRHTLAGLQGNQAIHPIGSDASHAWISLYVPDIGWVDLDPTNDTIPSVEHVTIAWGRDYDDVSPMKGVMIGGGEHTIHVEVNVTPYPVL